MKDIIDRLCELTEQGELKWEGGYDTWSERYSYRTRIDGDDEKVVGVQRADNSHYILSSNGMGIDMQLDAKRLFDIVSMQVANEDAERRASRAIFVTKHLRSWLGIEGKG